MIHKKSVDDKKKFYVSMLMYKVGHQCVWQYIQSVLTVERSLTVAQRDSSQQSKSDTILTTFRHLVHRPQNW